MSVLTSQNNLSVIIGKSIARTATVQYTDPSAASYLADGEVLVISETGAIMTDASTVGTAPRFRVIQRSGNRIIYSPVIHGANIKSFRGADGSAATEQVSYVGYDGATAGTTIDVSGTEDFIFNLTFTFNEQNWSQQLNNFPFLIENVGTMTEIGVAADLARQINYQMSNANTAPIAGQGPLVRATVLCNDAGAAITGTGTITAYQDSATITAGTNIDAIMAVGDYIRIASTATTGAIYRIVAMNTTAQTATLHMPFQDASVVASAEGNHQFIDAASAVAGDCGVAITGQALQWQLDFYKYMQVTFRTLLKEGWGATTSSTTQAVRAVGAGVQVSEMESFAEGFRGVLNRTTIPLPAGKSDADISVNYDIISISWFDMSDTTPVDGTKPSEQEIAICLVDGASQATTATNGVLTVLNAYMLTTPAALANVSL